MPSDDDDVRRERRFVALQAGFEDALGYLTAKFQMDGLARDAAIEQVAGRFEKLIEAASGPVFDDDGYLAPMQSCTEAEILRWFGTNAHREKLFERIHRWLELARSVKARRFFLDGSFVTEKDEPGDVDAVVLLPDNFDQRLRSSDSAAVELNGMFDSRQPEELLPAEDEEDWWGWFEFFTRTREENGRRKGLMEVML